jgi:predicted MFS family arabinose efflux permease
VGLGYLGAAVGIGNFGGLYLVSRATRFASAGWIFIAGTILHCLALLTFSTSSVFAVSWALLLVVGIGHACFGIMQSSIVLLAAADERRGQAMSAIAVAIGAGPFGRLQTGLLADAFGAPLAVGGEVAVAALLVATVAVTLPGLRQVNGSQERAEGS